MDTFDHMEIRCPRLGGEVTFAYCRQEGGKVPCSRTLKCWSNHFPVEAYLRKILTEDEWEHCFNQPDKDKISTIFEIVEALKNKKHMGV